MSYISSYGPALPMKNVSKAHNCTWISAGFGGIISVGYKGCITFSARTATYMYIYIKSTPANSIFQSDVHAKCQVPIAMHQPEVNERSGGYSLGLRNSDVSTYIR